MHLLKIHCPAVAANNRCNDCCDRIAVIGDHAHRVYSALSVLNAERRTVGILGKRFCRCCSSIFLQSADAAGRTSLFATTTNISSSNIQGTKGCTLSVHSRAYAIYGMPLYMPRPVDKTRVVAFLRSWTCLWEVDAARYCCQRPCWRTVHWSSIHDNWTFIVRVPDVPPMFVNRPQ